MSTIAAPSSTTNNSLLRLSVIGGLITGLLHLLVQVGLAYGLILKSPLQTARRSLRNVRAQ